METITQILDLIKEYVKPELLLLVPVMMLIGLAIKNSKKVNSAIIPFVLGGISIALSLMWVVGTSDVNGYKDVIMMAFTAITQGVLIAGLGVYFHQLYKQKKELN